MHCLFCVGNGNFYFISFQEIDYIMITGDYPAHDVWLQSRRGNLEHAKKVHDLVTKVFPDKMILPGVGNHESFPCNSYPPKVLLIIIYQNNCVSVTMSVRMSAI